MNLTAKYNGVPGCPRVTVLSMDREDGSARVRVTQADGSYEFEANTGSRW